MHFALSYNLVVLNSGMNLLNVYQWYTCLMYVNRKVLKYICSAGLYLCLWSCDSVSSDRESVGGPWYQPCYYHLAVCGCGCVGGTYLPTRL